MTRVDALTNPPPRLSYRFRSFLLQYNLILLGGSALFSLASASLLPLYVGLAAELVWVGLGSELGAVRRWLDRREVFLEVERPDEAFEETPISVEGEHSRRVRLLEEALAEIRKLGVPGSDPVFQRAAARLPLVENAFKSICKQHETTARFLAATPEAELVAELEHLQHTLSSEPDLGAKMAIRQALVLAKRRVAQHQSMTTELASYTLRIETIERAVAYALRQGRVLGPTKALASEIDAIIAELGPP